MPLPPSSENWNVLLIQDRVQTWVQSLAPHFPAVQPWAGGFASLDCRQSVSTEEPTQHTHVPGCCAESSRQLSGEDCQQVGPEVPPLALGAVLLSCAFPNRRRTFGGAAAATSGALGFLNNPPSSPGAPLHRRRGSAVQASQGLSFPVPGAPKKVQGSTVGK